MLEHGINKHRNLAFVKHRNGRSGKIQEWIDFAVKMKKTKNKALKGWKLVAAPGYDNKPMGKISPGDILIYKNGKSGHVMIAMGKPVKGAGFSTLRIADSTQYPKYNDARAADHKKNKKGIKVTGMGKGTIHLRINKAKVLQVEKKKDKADWGNLYVVRPV